MSKGWKETLEQQQSELERLEAFDAGLSDATLAIDKALRRPKSASKLPARQRLLESNQRRHSSVGTAATHRVQRSPDPNNHVEDDMIDPVDYLPSKGHAQTADAFDIYSDVPLDSGARESIPKAPETTIRFVAAEHWQISCSSRFQRARINILMKQVEDGLELKKQMTEQISELQKQLKAERDDNEQNKKRY